MGRNRRSRGGGNGKPETKQETGNPTENSGAKAPPPSTNLHASTSTPPPQQSQCTSDISPSSSTHSGSGADHHHHHYPGWNPMKEMSDSLLNTNDPRIRDRLVGVGDLDKKDVLCPFNDDKIPGGGCYKGTSCGYKHVPYSRNALRELPKLNEACVSKTEVTNTVTCLPIAMLPANDCISKVVIVTAFDPWNFYVVPELGWKCLCNAHVDVDEQNFTFDMLESLQSKMQTHFESLSTNPTKGHSRTRTEYLTGELVAVQMSTPQGSKAWYRAKVLSDAVMCSDDDVDLFSPVDVELQLLDFGIKCIKNSLHVLPLPLEFCTSLSPMAYKCKLFGISPILGTWSTAAIENFKQLVLDRYVIAEVVRTASPPWYSVQDEACMLNLYMKLEDGKYIDVAELLINAGFGLEWNMYPKQPFLNDLLEGRQHRFSLSEYNK